MEGSDMAKYDGSGDISFTGDELRAIAARILEAAEHANQKGGEHAISMGISSGEVIVNIRPARFRGPVNDLQLSVRQYGKSLL